jgi:hypothetical protein
MLTKLLKTRPVPSPRTAGKRGLAVLLMFLLSTPIFAQQDQGQSSTQEQDSLRRQGGLPGLAIQNLDRVAASAAQIEQVLQRDPGLMVELKRWVAKEATDNGQVLEDSEITDEGILDRLARDVPFRSVATRLLQRYGFLMPAVNPGSEYAKSRSGADQWSEMRRSNPLPPFFLPFRTCRLGGLRERCKLAEFRKMNQTKVKTLRCNRDRS